jgi:hypothetical protein
MTNYTETIKKRISTTTLVTVNRNHRTGEDPASPTGYDYGPMPISQALKEGLFDSSNSTMRVTICVAEGEFIGAPVEFFGKQFFAVTYINH